MAKDLLTPTDLLLIGGSAGSLDLILHGLPQLKPGALPAILIVLHRKPGDDSSLTDLLRVKTRIPVKEAEEKELPERGTMYVAPADYHILFENDRSFSLDYSEKVNYSRPSIDVTFQSAAAVFGSALAAILLSGASEDGAEGLKTIKEAGGKIAVQDPEKAAVAYMPMQALLRVGKNSRLLDDSTFAGFINGL